MLVRLAGKPVWVSFTLEDSTRCCLRSEETLAAAVQSISQHAHLAAVLVNCCAPDAVTAAIPVLKQHVPDGEQPSLAYIWRSALQHVHTRSGLQIQHAALELSSVLTRVVLGSCRTVHSCRSTADAAAQLSCNSLHNALN
jgi:S-methylmethionine-dependent homocysteine/selenocysteine methylase